MERAIVICSRCGRGPNGTKTWRLRATLCPPCYVVACRRGDFREAFCTKGHDPWNMIVLANGRKRCRACKRAATIAKLGKLGRPRRYRRLSHAYLSTAQIRAAHVLYEGGLSLGAVAELGWERWGFASMEAARQSLAKSFRLDGLPTRSLLEAQRLRRRKALAREGEGLKKAA